MNRKHIPAPSQKRFRQQAFSLIEMIGVLAVIAILAAVLLPALIKQTDKLAADQESATLQSFGTAIQNNALRTRIIPDNTTWISVITNELGMNSLLVSSNPRNRARVFVIDANGLTPMPYPQTSVGFTNTSPPQPRFMIVSSLGTNLRSGLISNPGLTIFNDLWSTTAGTIPANAIWSGWNKGRGDDLIVQRVNLSPYFVHLILTTNNSTANALYSIDLGAITNIASIPTRGSLDAYFIQGSVLNLYSNSSAFPDSQQILQRDTSFVYDQNVWRSSITSISLANTNVPDFSGIVNAFANAGTPGDPSNPQPNKVALDFIAYMRAYNDWANATPTPFPNGTLKNAAITAYTTMMLDVNNLVETARP